VLLVAGLGLVATAVSGTLLGRKVMKDPSWRAWAIERVLRDTGVTLHTGVVTVDEDGATVHVKDLRVDSSRGRLTASEVRSGVPGLWSMLVLGRVDLGSVEVTDLHVTRARGMPRPASAGGSARVVVDRLRVRNGRISLPELPDVPLPRTEVTGIDVDLRAVSMVLGRGMSGGKGRLSVAKWRSGAVSASQISVDSITLRRDGIRLRDGRFHIAGGAGAGIVDLTQSPGKPMQVHAQLQVKDIRLEHLVATATGNESPLTGVVAGKVDIQVDGRQAGATTKLDVEVKDGALLLGPEVSPALRRALKVAPFLKLQGGKVWLGPTEAQLTLQPGRVEVERLVHQGKARALAAQGTVTSGKLDLVVRLVPRRRADTRAGFGIQVTGPAGNLDVRRAKSEDLHGVGDSE